MVVMTHRAGGAIITESAMLRVASKTQHVVIPSRCMCGPAAAAEPRLCSVSCQPGRRRPAACVGAGPTRAGHDPNDDLRMRDSRFPQAAFQYQQAMEFGRILLVVAVVAGISVSLLSARCRVNPTIGENDERVYQQRLAAAWLCTIVDNGRQPTQPARPVRTTVIQFWNR